MSSTWDELANSARWRGVVAFIRQWIGPFDSVFGIAAADLDVALHAKGLNLPTALREWYLLAGRWSQEGSSVWIRPHEMTVYDGIIPVMTDDHGINHWGVRIADCSLEDPPVFRDEPEPAVIDFPSFTAFVPGMILNDVIFGYESESPVELDPEAVRVNLTRLVSAQCGGYYTDGALESASVIAFAYPLYDEAYGKARTGAGRAVLEELRKAS